MSKNEGGIASLRSKVSELYWKAVDTFGTLVPTPQVIGATLAGAIVQFLQVKGIDLSPFGITPGFISVAAASAVAYLIGPERIKEQDTHYEAEILPGPPALQIVGHSDKPPALPGEFVGPEDDSSAPGTGLT